jgi:DMSO/TMAO reductase YedYZ heme-binding membrane subunit
MLATSNDAALRRLGKTNWRWLHKFGAHYLAVVFGFTYLSQFLGGLNKPPILLILAIAAIVLRIFITLKSRWEAS